MPVFRGWLRPAFELLNSPDPGAQKLSGDILDKHDLEKERKESSDEVVAWESKLEVAKSKVSLFGKWQARLLLLGFVAIFLARVSAPYTQQSEPVLPATTQTTNSTAQIGAPVASQTNTLTAPQIQSLTK